MAFGLFGSKKSDQNSALPLPPAPPADPVQAVPAPPMPLPPLPTAPFSPIPGSGLVMDVTHPGAPVGQSAAPLPAPQEDEEEIAGPTLVADDSFIDPSAFISSVTTDGDEHPEATPGIPELPPMPEAEPPTPPVPVFSAERTNTLAEIPRDATAPAPVHSDTPADTKISETTVPEWARSAAAVTAAADKEKTAEIEAKPATLPTPAEEPEGGFSDAAKQQVQQALQKDIDAEEAAITAMEAEHAAAEQSLKAELAELDAKQKAIDEHKATIDGSTKKVAEMREELRARRARLSKVLQEL